MITTNIIENCEETKAVPTVTIGEPTGEAIATAEARATTKATAEARATIEPTSILISHKEAARMCGGLSQSMWFSLISAGKTPAPIQLGRRRLWRRDELEAWCQAGCPNRDKWEQLKATPPTRAIRAIRATTRATTRRP
jgi:predicted DNA-binding transcriptional regulator AlpA